MTQNLTGTSEEKKQWAFIFLCALFVTNVVVAELISNKLIEIPLEFSILGYSFGPFVTIVGVLPWPIIFLLTDLLNEFYGKRAVRRLSWMTTILIAYCFLIVSFAMAIPAKTLPESLLATDASFNQVFGQSRMVIIGSITAFLISQLVDVTLFHWIKNKTGNRYIWLRSTGSSVVSQLIDSFVVLYIGFVVPGSINFSQFLDIAPTNYLLKLIIAIALTPLIYVGHYFLRNYLSKK